MNTNKTPHTKLITNRSDIVDSGGEDDDDDDDAAEEGRPSTSEGDPPVRLVRIIHYHR